MIKNIRKCNALIQVKLPLGGFRCFIYFHLRNEISYERFKVLIWHPPNAMENESKNETKKTNQTPKIHCNYWSNNDQSVLLWRHQTAIFCSFCRFSLCWAATLIPSCGLNSRYSGIWVVCIAEQWPGATWICMKSETLCSGSELWHLGILWMLTSESQRSPGGPPVSFLRRGERARRRTRGGWGERGNHKRGYWLIWREERGRLMMPELTSGNNGGFLIIYISIQESISGTLVKREIECPVRHTSVYWEGALVEMIQQPWCFDSQCVCSFLTATNIRQMGKIDMFWLKYQNI